MMSHAALNFILIPLDQFLKNVNTSHKPLDCVHIGLKVIWAHNILKALFKKTVIKLQFISVVLMLGMSENTN